MSAMAFSRRFAVIAAGLIVLLAIGALGIRGYRHRHHENPWTSIIRKPVDRQASRDDPVQLIPIYPTDKVAAPVLRGNFWASPQIVNLPGRAPFLLLVGSTGSVAAVELNNGRRLWQTELGRGSNDEIFARAAPLQFQDRVMIAYSATDRKSGIAEQRAVVLGLEDGRIDRKYPTLLFNAELPAVSGGKTKFDPQWHLARAIALVPSRDGSGRAYVTFSGNSDQSDWHGWLFEVDLDTWGRGFQKRAISSVFVTTPENDCNDGTGGRICGGGIWAYAGALVHHSEKGPEILVQTGNGRFDLSRGDYSEALLRLTPGLKFAPQCDMRRCANDNPRDPSPQCLSTCQNLFVPRLKAEDPPVRAPDGACDGKTYLECLERMDWDFGASSPVRVETGGHSYYVTAGKAGDVYLIDGDILGIMYDRKQAGDYCGTDRVKCPDPNAGLAITQPVSTLVGNIPVVILGTYNEDNIHAAGVVAYRIVGAPTKPRLEEAWRVPEAKSAEARIWFRAPPTRPVIGTLRGEPIVWVADNAREGRILGIRVRDGRVLANVRSAGWPMRNSRPVIYRHVLYLPSAVQNRGDLTWIEAYRIVEKY
ncbi:MAG TPA: hypothetical protein VJ859_01415 [Allosphingosinicella sp.]|nr:hypothetical protein [Allosphingosinicella sp.]